MTPASLPRMFYSEGEGWKDLARAHPGVAKMTLFLVAPMSLLPPLMNAYSQIVHPGRVTPLVEPALGGGELLLVGAVFFAIELAMVALMAVYIQRLGESVGVSPSYEEAYALAAVAPVPLWLASLALFVPNLAFNVLAVAVAWVGSVALIRHAVRPLFKVQDLGRAHHMSNSITFAGVGVWLCLMAVLLMVLGMLMGWR
ncbi:MAG: DUF1282 family protein [Rhodocyclaceae bacterium]|nr:DUF1282 family protein [Rhodocyclaceae bacterium]MBX3670701.1 DUF1282 family protein [Rhodocyclaceae bacterium]